MARLTKCFLFYLDKGLRPKYWKVSCCENNKYFNTEIKLRDPSEVIWKIYIISQEQEVYHFYTI